MHSIIAWAILGLETLLLGIWVWDIFFRRNGTDPAGKGFALVFLIGLILYILVGVVLMLVNKPGSIITVIIMGAVPLILVSYGLLRGAR